MRAGSGSRASVRLRSEWSVIADRPASSDQTIASCAAAVQPDRLPLRPLALEAAALGETLRRLVLRMRSELEPADAFVRTASRRARRTARVISPRPRPACAAPGRRSRSCRDGGGTRSPRRRRRRCPLGDGEVEAVASRASVVRDCAAARRSRRHAGAPACSASAWTSSSLIVERTTARSPSRNSRRTTTPSVSRASGGSAPTVSDTYFCRRYSLREPCALTARAAAAAAACRRRAAGAILAGLARRGVLRPLDELLRGDAASRPRASGRA